MKIVPFESLEDEITLTCIGCGECFTIPRTDDDATLESNHGEGVCQECYVGFVQWLGLTGLPN